MEKTQQPARKPGRAQPLQIGEFLVRAGVVKAEDVEKALGIQKAKGGRLGSILTSLKCCTEDDIRQALREQMGVEVVNLQQFQPNDALVELLSVDLIRKYEVIPLKQVPGKLWIAMLDPYNLIAIDDIRFRTGILKLVITTCTEGDFRRFVREHLANHGVIDDILKGGDFYNRAIKSLRADESMAELLDEEKPAAALASFKLKLASSESPIITLVNFLLIEAIKRQASDIHIEPSEDCLRVRLRIDGLLQLLITPPKDLSSAITARIKVMADMDITKRRIPQDGHLVVSYEEEPFHFRVSTMPTAFGQKCVLRLLRRDPAVSSLDLLTMRPSDLAVLKKVMRAPQGLILVTGPTGSGKTTTVHTSLKYISNPQINIVTLEDPVEVTFSGINHVPINLHGGISFASGLRALLRQDPDVIFVGELRDPEVANIAMQAAQTGHLVLSTLHTNSSVETMERLQDMGVPHYVLASSLLLIVAQRLLRRICPYCAEPYRLSAEEIEWLGLDPRRGPPPGTRTGRGCKECFGTGYLGRMAVFEQVHLNREIRELIRNQAGSEALLRAARNAGTRTIFEAGVEKVLFGETTPAEVRRVLNLE